MLFSIQYHAREEKELLEKRKTARNVDAARLKWHLGERRKRVFFTLKCSFVLIEDAKYFDTWKQEMYLSVQLHACMLAFPLEKQSFPKMHLEYNSVYAGVFIRKS